MLITLPSGQTILTPAEPRTWVEQADAVTGTPVMAWDLEQQISSAVMFHRRPLMFQGLGGPQSIPTNSFTPVALTEVQDIARGHNDDANTSRVQAPATATGDNWFLCTGMIPFGTAASGLCIAGIRLNGGTVYEGGKLPLGSAHASTAMVCDLLNLQSFEYAELMAYQNSGGSISLSASASKIPQFSMRWATVTDPDGTAVALPDTPRTWTAADVLTADSTGAGEVPFNAHVRDVLRWLRYPPVCRIDSRTTTQTIPSSAWTSISFGFESIDNYGGHDLAVNPTRYTCQRAGLYFVYGLANIAETNTTGYRVSRLLVNGTTAYAGTSARPATGSTFGSGLAATAMLRLEVGDYVELQAYQSSGSALAVKDGTGDASRLICVWRSL